MVIDWCVVLFVRKRLAQTSDFAVAYIIWLRLVSIVFFQLYVQLLSIHARWVCHSEDFCVPNQRKICSHQNVYINKSFKCISWFMYYKYLVRAINHSPKLVRTNAWTQTRDLLNDSVFMRFAWNRPWRFFRIIAKWLQTVRHEFYFHFYICTSIEISFGTSRLITSTKCNFGCFFEFIKMFIFNIEDKSNNTKKMLHTFCDVRIFHQNCVFRNWLIFSVIVGKVELKCWIVFLWCCSIP